MSHMEIGVRELRNHTSRVIDAVRAGEVVLTVHGEEAADIVPHGGRTDGCPATLSGGSSADAGLQDDLDAHGGQILAEL